MLNSAHDLGVRMLAYRADFTPAEATLGAQIPVDFPHSEKLT
jgi:hypothetical protein